MSSREDEAQARAAAAAEARALDELRSRVNRTCDIGRDGNLWTVTGRVSRRTLRRASAAGLELAIRAGGMP